MSQLRLDIAIILQRMPVVSRWINERWAPVAVEVVGIAHGPALAGEAAVRGAATSRSHVVAADAAAELHRRSVCLLDGTDTSTRWRFTGHALELHRSEGEGYYLNLTSPEPKVFVMWRMLEPEALTEGGPAARPELATVSYNEAARMLDGGEQVDAVPLPTEVRAWMEPFVAAHYKPEPKRKVRRRDPLHDDAAEAGIGRRPANDDEHDPRP